ncbi:MAG TPA: O-antigen ligase family protein [Kiritimatiellia bacterium]|nr:O-antigen ligase family protein [Kiritimatiellia bacterium]HMP34419.1 O-antigen ligase family protein [Kiritimatiellia bacterium]
MSLWAFRFVLFYICVMMVQPQNRFMFLHPFRIALVSITIAALLHIVSAAQENRPIIRFGPATITALCLIVFAFLSLHFGVMQTNNAWNSDIDIIVKNAICLILVEAMAFTVERVWAVQATMMLCTLWWIKGGIRLAGAGATYAGDRIMGPAVSLVENPNGFAYLLTLMIPLYLYFYQKSTNKYLRWAFLAGALASVYIVLQTGSRTGLLALIAVGAFLLPKYGKQHKMTLIIGAAAVFIFTTSIGALNMERYKTIMTSIHAFFEGGYEEKDPSLMNQDEQSAWERKMKNRHSWLLIKEYPVFGVGLQPDQGLVGQKYQYAMGQVHNEWLYVGVQMGFIGMGMYASFMLCIWIYGWRVQRLMRDSWPALSDLGWTIKMQGVVFLVGGFFSPIGWNPLFLIVAACASALWANIQQQSWNAATVRT